MAKNNNGNDKKNIHVVPHPEGWAIKREGAERASRVTETKKEAVDYARQQARQDGVELIIHKKDGTIQSRDSHGNDPYPPKG